MYIEFDLLRGYELIDPVARDSWSNEIWDGIVAIRREAVHADLDTWSQTYGIPHHAKFINRRLKVTLPENSYEFWALTWDPQNKPSEYYRLVEPMDIDNSSQ